MLAEPTACLMNQTVVPLTRDRRTHQSTAWTEMRGQTEAQGTQTANRQSGLVTLTYLTTDQLLAVLQAMASMTNRN